MADPLKPYPDKTFPIVWTEERIEWWAKSQALGIQYYTAYGPVYCPPRNWLTARQSALESIRRGSLWNSILGQGGS